MIRHELAHATLYIADGRPIREGDDFERHTEIDLAIDCCIDTDPGAGGVDFERIEIEQVRDCSADAIVVRRPTAEELDKLGCWIETIENEVYDKVN
jgi:hypothetical protein